MTLLDVVLLWIAASVILAACIGPLFRDPDDPEVLHQPERPIDFTGRRRW